MQGFQRQAEGKTIIAITSVEGNRLALQAIAGSLTLPVTVQPEPLPAALQRQRSLPLPVFALPLEPAGAGLQAQVLIAQHHRQLRAAVQRHGHLQGLFPLRGELFRQRQGCRRQGQHLILPLKIQLPIQLRPRQHDPPSTFFYGAVITVGRNMHLPWRPLQL